MGASTLRNNVVANAAGRLWAILANIVFVPIYIKYLGSESYGLIVFYVTLTASLQVLDAGLSTALSREMALQLTPAAGAADKSGASILNLTKTIEGLSYGVGIVIGLALFLIAPVIATGWLHGDSLPIEQKTNALRLIGVVLAVQWPSIAYQGALMGMQDQVRLNAIRIGTSSLQAIGGVCVLAFVKPTIEALLLWILFAQAVNTISLRYAVWKDLSVFGSDRKPQFELQALASVWRFALGMAGIALLSAALTQADKLIVSKFVSLSDFAVYGIAFTVCGVLGLAAQPILAAVVPRLTQFSGANNTEGMRRLYLLASEVVALLTIPGCMILVFHAEDLMRVWLGDTRDADHVAAIVPIIALGSLANALVTMPYGLQISTGWTRLSVRKNILAVCLVVPALLFLVPRYGTAGAAWVWVALNLGYMFFEIPLMHRRLLTRSMVRWYSMSVALPLAVGTAIGFLSTSYVPHELPRLALFAWLCMWFLAAVIAMLIVLPSLRGEMRKLVPHIARRP